MCPLTKFKGGLNLLYEADDDTVTWLESTANCSSRKIIINNVHRSQYLLDEWACLVRELLVRVTAIVAVAARAVTMKPDARPRLVVVAAAVGASAQARPVVGTQLWLLGTQRSAAVLERAFRALQRRQNIQFSSITTTTTTLHTFNGPLSGTTRVSRYQKGKTNPDFTEARDVEWQWHQLHLDNHASTPPLSFLQAGCPSCRPTNTVTALIKFQYRQTWELAQWPPGS